MPPDTVTRRGDSPGSARSGSSGFGALANRERTLWQATAGAQAFWVTVALAAIVVAMSALRPDAFGSVANFHNIARNVSIIGIMALGMTAVVITGGIDLSVGSIMSLAVVVTGLILQADHSVWLAIGGGLLAGLACGVFNGVLVSLLGLPPFLVTLGTLAMARSASVVLSENRMIYEFGHDSGRLFAIGGGEWLGMANSVWLLLILAVAVGAALRLSVWGRHLFAVGGNEQAARVTGVPVERVKVSAYALSALCASVAGIMVLGWQGSAVNTVGTGYELLVIAACVIGGARLVGGEGGAYGAVVGAALVEVIRTTLLMAGVDSNWQGLFVGAFILVALLLDRSRRRARDPT